MMKEESISGLIRPYRWELAFLSKAADVACVICSLWFICWYYDRPWDVQMLPAITATLLFQVYGEVARIYRSQRSELLGSELLSIVAVWAVVVFSLLLFGYLAKASADYSRLAIGTWFVVAPLLLAGWRVGLRIALRHIRSAGMNSRSVAIAGASTSGVEVAEIIKQSSWMGLRLVGFFDDRKPKDNRVSWVGSIEGNFEKLINMARLRDVDVIYIALPLKSAERIHMLLDKLADTTASVYIVPETFWTEVMRGNWVNLGSLPTVSVFETPFYGLNGWLKRIEDILLGIVVLLLIALPMLLIGLCVKLTSSGPILFKQKRYGLDGNEIDVWKFRTLAVCDNDGKVSQVTRDDNRVTRFGAFLRRSSLDELPQFINVMQGTMSIVGPRPHAVVHNEHYRSLIKGYMLRHKVKPGITGWAQINGWRGETETLDKMEQRVKHDLWYIHNWSFWLDLKIIVLTMFRGFTGHNAF